MIVCRYDDDDCYYSVLVLMYTTGSSHLLVCSYFVLCCLHRNPLRTSIGAAQIQNGNGSRHEGSWYSRRLSIARYGFIACSAWSYCSLHHISASHSPNSTCSGGIDKYFKEFPDGGYWKGKNYVFDKRFAHAPQAVHVQQQEAAVTATVAKDDEPVTAEATKTTNTTTTPLSKCEACLKPWDKFRGKRRCPTCGVPSLICRDCWQADQDGIRKIDKTIRCDLCVEQNIWSKRELRAKEERELAAYEAKLKERGLLLARKVAESETKQTKKVPVISATSVSPAAIDNPDNVTRLYLKNMCRKNMTEEVLMDHLDGITHIVWKTDRKNGHAFLGQGWVEMESPEAAVRAVAKSGQKVLGRPLYIEYQSPDGKDAWPPPMSSVTKIR